MKTISTITLSLIMVFILSNAMAQQDKKLVKAEKKFCTSLQNLVSAIKTLEVANEGSSMDEFRKAYKSAEKAYNKFEKSAEKLEKVEIKESQQAYNKLVDAVNNIDGDTKTAEAAGQIDEHINSTADEIADILTVVCQY